MRCTRIRTFEGSKTTILAIFSLSIDPDRDHHPQRDRILVEIDSSIQLIEETPPPSTRYHSDERSA
jgi:hypothetical protein